MLKQKNRWIALGTLGAVVATSLLGGATAAQAKSSTWKKIAIGAGIVTGYGLLKHKGKVATIGGLVTAGSYLKYRHDKKSENRARQSAIYNQGRYSAVSPYRYNSANNAYRSTAYPNGGYNSYRSGNTSNSYRSGSSSNGYRHAAYSGRTNGFNGQHRGWTKSSHKRKHHKHKNHKCHCR